MEWPAFADEAIAPLAAFATSLAIGLLIGVERERNPAAKAGVRTFALTALFGTLAASLGDQASGGWLPAAGLAIVGLAIVSAYYRAPPEDDPGTTTVIALVVAYGLGAMCWYGERSVAVTLAVVVTALLYFKPELHNILNRFERRDLLSVLQFATLSLVILPILPDRGYGPYGALNPYQIWLIVVLVSGVSLAGYIALKLAGTRHGLVLVGFLGGLVSSTATALAYSRHARSGAATDLAAGVIQIANLVVLARVALVSAVVSPAILPHLLPVLAAALVAGAAATFVYWRRRLGGDADFPVLQVSNPTELRTSLGFGLLFAVVLVLAAWLSDVAGKGGLYLVALVSGLTDVDAITLSTLQLFNVQKVAAAEAVAAIAIAVLSNTGFKLGLVLGIGGRALARRVIVPAVAAVAAGGAAVLLL